MSDEDKDSGNELNALKAQLAEATKGLDALKAKNDELLSETKAAKAAKRDAEERAKVEAEELARKNGNVEALEKSWQDKLTKREAELSGEIKARDSQLHDLTVNATALSLASRLAVPGSADVLIPHLARRLAMELQDGRPVVRVLDNTGKPSALSVDELEKEFSNNAAFAPLIVASKATGGGASGSKGGGAASKSITRTAFNALAPAEQSKFSIAGGTLTD